VESKALFFKTLFLWSATDFSMSNYHVFLDLFSASS
jgi:hypothetical protein